MILPLNTEKAKKWISDYLVGSAFLDAILPLISERDSHFYTFVTKDYDENFLHDFENKEKGNDGRDRALSPFEEYSRFISSRVQEDSILFEDLRQVFETTGNTDDEPIPGASSLLGMKRVHEHREAYPGGPEPKNDDFVIKSSRDFRAIFYVLKCSKDLLISKLYVLDKKEGWAFMADNLIAFAIRMHHQDAMLFWSKEQIDSRAESPYTQTH